MGRVKARGVTMSASKVGRGATARTLDGSAGKAEEPCEEAVQFGSTARQSRPHEPPPTTESPTACQAAHSPRVCCTRWRNGLVRRPRLASMRKVLENDCVEGGQQHGRESARAARGAGRLLQGGEAGRAGSAGSQAKCVRPRQQAALLPAHLGGKLLHPGHSVCAQLPQAGLVKRKHLQVRGTNNGGTLC
mgnify:CR=1 FL=1